MGQMPKYDAVHLRAEMQGTLQISCQYEDPIRYKSRHYTAVDMCKAEKAVQKQIWLIVKNP
eukprot:6184005-Pleurochrysis_carterae.AAC.8